MMPNRRAVAVVLIGGLVGPGLIGTALAHDSDVGPNGGPMIDLKGHHVELLQQNTDLVIVISDAAHAPVASKGSSGRAVILEGSAQRTVPLSPQEPDRLTGKLDRPLASGARIVVSAKLGSGKDLLARFVLK